MPFDTRRSTTPSRHRNGTTDRRDALLLANLQYANLQLRCVMQLSDPMVQAFLSDALDHRLFTLFFYIEDTRQNAVLSLPFDLDDPQELRRQMTNTTRCLDGLAPAVQLTNLASHAIFQPSLIEGHTVDDVIAVLAGAPTEQDVKAAMDEVAHRAAADRCPLH